MVGLGHVRPVKLMERIEMRSKATCDSKLFRADSVDGMSVCPTFGSLQRWILAAFLLKNEWIIMVSTKHTSKTGLVMWEILRAPTGHDEPVFFLQI